MTTRKNFHFAIKNRKLLGIQILLIQMAKKKKKNQGEGEGGSNAMWFKKASKIISNVTKWHDIVCK